MEKIVKDLIKLDLHIHSIYSKKDKKLVSNNTVENIPVLMEKLEKENVNMIAITDHNAFSYELYNEIKSNMGKCKTLVKVLPGIEFDVDLLEKRIHVVSIFDDLDENKVANIESVLDQYNFDNSKKNAFKESTFKDILCKIDLNVVIIAHQKSGIYVENHNENLSGIGEEAFDEIISYDYFDAVEFRSGKIEGILNSYRKEKDLKNLRYITGTDCHDWTVYPAQKQNDKSIMKYTFMKSLPSFKGLVMALTEPRRLSTAYSSIPVPYIDKLDVEINGVKEKIELSSGINVVIGDNSVGKSLFFEYLYNPSLKSITPASKKSGYKHFAEVKKIKITPFDENIKSGIRFDRQGEIRSRFQSGSSLTDVTFFTNKFKELNTDVYNSKFQIFIEKVIKLIEFNQEKKDKLLELNYSLDIPAEIDDKNYNLRIISDLNYSAIDYSNLISAIELAQTKIEILLEEELLEKDDKEYLIQTNQNLLRMIVKYKNLKFKEYITESIVAVVNSATSEFEEEIKNTAEAQENKLSIFKTNITNMTNKILDVIEIENKAIPSVLNMFEAFEIKEEDNPIGNYHFITRVLTPNITKSIMEKLLMFPFSRKESIECLNKIDLDNFESNCKKTEIEIFQKDGVDIKTVYKDCVKNYIKNNILKIENVILLDNDDISTGNSPGKNALIYLDVFSKDSTIKFYMVDQPGDDVSQNKISTELIKILRKMSESKQVLFITHKPELVVNLDVDNVIILKNDENNNLKIAYGSLEYMDKEINVLSEVANILDGGVEVIRRRWKRYDK